MQRKRILAAGLAALLLIGVLSGCGNASYTLFSVNVHLPHSWTMKYWKYKGSESQRIVVDGDTEQCEISVTVTTDAGKLSLAIVDLDGHAMYSGTEIPTSAFTVLVPPGEYTVRVKADDHSGGFALKWGNRDGEDGAPEETQAPGEAHKGKTAA